MSSRFQRDNHYVPCLYLKNFSETGQSVQVYRTLVSHPELPLWKSHSIRGIGYRSHLYTRLAAGIETDDIEKWLEHEFETPAAEPIQKAIADESLTPLDWEILARSGSACPDAGVVPEAVHPMESKYSTARR